MKKIILILSVLIIFLTACKKSIPPTMPADATATGTQGAQTNTPSPDLTATFQAVETLVAQIGRVYATQTAQALLTQTALAGFFTPTCTATDAVTMTVTETFTITLTATSLPSPDQTAIAQTVETLVAQIGRVYATQTAQALLTQTALAGFFTPTCTVTYAATMTVTETFTATPTATSIPTPNQTETAAAIGTIIANIQQTENAVAILSRTSTPTATATSNQTATATATPTALPTAITIDSAVLISVPAGTFTQTDGTNSFSHTISAFKLGKYEVTYDLWYTVYQWAVSNGYTFANAGREGSAGTIGSAPTTAKYEPVTTVNWRDVIVWCNAYSQKSGITPVYCSDAGLTTSIKDSTNGAFGSSINTTAGSYDNPYVNWGAYGYRLPTEGEWQYAASYRDGSIWTPYNYASGAAVDYSDAAVTGLVAWYSANSGSVAQNVGGKTANALGIYDMSGNVWEWCWDWYGIYPGAVVDYRGPASGSYRVIRGGSCNYSAYSLQVGYRYYNFLYAPYYADSFFGFRLARTF